MPVDKIALFYATVSGNAELLAYATAEHLMSLGVLCGVANLADCPDADLAAGEVALIFASTWGEGDAPPEAAEFCRRLGDGRDRDLTRLRFAVVALGSNAYPEFCACGLRIDSDLARRGAVRLLPCLRCDVRFRRPFETWLETLEQALRKDGLIAPGAESSHRGSGEMASGKI